MEKLNRKNREKYRKTILSALENGEIENFRPLFLDLHPSDQLDVFISFEKEKRTQVYHYLSPKEFAEVFSRLDIRDQKLFFLELDERYSSSMFNHMFTDNVANFLTEINKERAESILAQMANHKAAHIRNLLTYDRETAGSIMTKEFVWIEANHTVSNVLEHLRSHAPKAEIVYYLYVIDSKRNLVGVVSLRDLITAQPDEMIENIMNKKVISVPDDMDQEEVGKTIQKYDFLAVPVVTKENRLLGIITVDDIMDILEEEMTEDIEDLSATKGISDTDSSARETAKSRAPWIMVLMVLGLFTARVIGFFEETLEQVVLLSAFIPMIMDSAGNVGTQSLTVAVRGLALGRIKKDEILRLVKREISAGFLLGIVTLVSTSILIPLFYGSWMLGLIVGVSLLITLTASTAVGFLVPLIINKLNFDPAIASGPFITTVNDVLGLSIYFSIATALMHLL